MIGRKLDDFIAAKGLYLSREFAGHVIGAEPIIEPNIICNRSMFGGDHVLAEGTVISLLVLAHKKKPRSGVRDDKWTVHDRDCNLSACFSNMLMITSGRPLILTSAYPFHVDG